MTAVHEPSSTATAASASSAAVAGRDHDRVVAEPPPKQVLLSPAVAPGGSRRWAKHSGRRTRWCSTRSTRPRAIVVDTREDGLAELIQRQRAATRVIVVHTGHPSEQPMAPADDPRPRCRHVPRAGVAARARRPREGVDPIVGRVPAPAPGPGGVGARSDRVDDEVGGLDRRPDVDAVVQAELADRGRGDLGDERHGAVDVDADPVAEQIGARARGRARRCGDSPRAVRGASSPSAAGSRRTRRPRPGPR